MLKIKVHNIRSGGSLFHYAHFICDLLFPEIIAGMYNYEEVIRKKNIYQTIGNFSLLYEDIMNNKNKEIGEDEFNNIGIPYLEYPTKEQISDFQSFDFFRNFIFSKINFNEIIPRPIDNLKLNSNNTLKLVENYIYPEIILVKRGERIDLIDDSELKEINTNITTGKERREIDKIDELDKVLHDFYGNKFRSIYFEKISFKEQVKHFYNAKIIICAHGAVMSNMFFCKENTKIIEITCGKKWEFFKVISSILNLEHIQLEENNFDLILKYLQETLFYSEM
jgi:hypothetical protein